MVAQTKIKKRMRKSSMAAVPTLMLGTALALSACNTAGVLDTSETFKQGYVVDEQTLQLVPPGSSREQVLLALGTPTTTQTFDNEVFYYISQTRRRAAAFLKPRLVDQRVLAVYFNEDDTVERIADYGLKDGKVFDFVSRTTPTRSRDETFLGQVLSGTIGAGMPSLPGGTRSGL